MTTTKGPKKQDLWPNNSNKSWDFVNTMNDSSSKIGQVFECSMSKIEVV